jgi:hypothetical protein
VGIILQHTHTQLLDSAILHLQLNKRILLLVPSTLYPRALAVKHFAEL